MSNDAPIIAKPKPFLVSVEERKRYFWCACGRSKAQPFCDGSHEGTSIKPVSFIAEKTKDVLLCGCKHTKAGPFCDGAHNNLDDTYEEASEAEISAMANAREIPRDKGAFGKAMLDGGVYVLTPDKGEAERRGTLSTLPLITHADGAKFLSFVQMIAEPGHSLWRLHQESDSVLFIVSGKGAVNIGGVCFDVAQETGIFVKRGEAFRFEAREEMLVMAAICPEPDIVLWPDNPAASFDGDNPKRSVEVANAKLNVMADRFYQILIGEQSGSTEITQFIGGIPKSRAAFHRHLYEEAIVILSGEGVMWTQTRYAPVKPGDIIFLPARQGHSLECTTDKGMRLMGAFYPSGSPAINY